VKQIQNLELPARQVHSLICCAHPADDNPELDLDLIKPHETLIKG